MLTGRARRRSAFTIIELLVTVSIIALLVSILLPAVGKARDSARLTRSVTNLRDLGSAHASYSATYADRQLTFVLDGITQYGSDTCSAYSNYGNETNNSHPNIILGWGPIENDPNSPRILWQYRLDGTYPGHHCWAGQPINWASSGSPVYGFGHFRFGHQTRALTPFINGRYYDPVFFAPKDVTLYEIVKDGFESPAQFSSIAADDGTEGSVLYTSSYTLSPAAMFAPDVFKWDPETKTTFTNPWSLQAGLRSPSPSQALYPSLKTHMLEHHWLQDPAAACNPGFDSPGGYGGCEQYYFNHAIESRPVTLFYDGHVELMGIRQAQCADGRHLAQAGYGLWSRDSPMGENGFFIDYGYDQANSSLHILTTDGIRGRDIMSQ